MSALEAAIRQQSASDVVASVQALMQAGKSNFRLVQTTLSPLLFGPGAILPPADSLQLLLSCLVLCTNQDAELPSADEVQARGTGSPVAVSHLLVELIPAAATSAAQPGLRSQAAQLIERQCLTAGTARLAVKVAQQFSLTTDDFANKQAIIDFVGALLMDRATFSPAIALMMLLEGLDEDFDKASTLGDLVAAGLESTAEKWVASLGKEYQVMYVEQCIVQDRLKAASRAVRQFGLREEFPDVESMYRTKTITRLVAKRLWAVAATFVGSDAELQALVVRQMVEAGEGTMAEEYRALFGLPASVLTIDPQAAAAEEARRQAYYLQLDTPPENRLMVDSRETLEIARQLLSNAQLVGLDVEWKPSHIGPTSSAKSPASLLQVATETHAFVFDLLTLGDTPELDTCLAAAFHNKNTLKVGFELAGDLGKLASSYPWLTSCQRVESVLELRHMWVAHLQAKSPTVLKVQRGAGLSTLCQTLLGKPLDKSMQVSDWEARPLSQRQFCYACQDARVLVRLFRHFQATLPTFADVCKARVYTYVATAPKILSAGGSDGSKGGPGGGGDGSGGTGGHGGGPGSGSGPGHDGSGTGGEGGGGGRGDGGAHGGRGKGSGGEVNGGAAGGGPTTHGLSVTAAGVTPTAGGGSDALACGTSGGEKGAVAGAPAEGPAPTLPALWSIVGTPGLVPPSPNPAAQPRTTFGQASAPAGARAVPPLIEARLRHWGLLESYMWLSDSLHAPAARPQPSPPPSDPTLASAQQSASRQPSLSVPFKPSSDTQPVLFATTGPCSQHPCTTRPACDLQPSPTPPALPHTTSSASAYTDVELPGPNFPTSAAQPLPAAAAAASGALPALATALGAAQLLRVPASRVAKSVAVLAEAQPWVLVTRGDARLEMRKVAAALGCTNRRKVRIASAEDCLSMFGYQPGTLPPFGHPPGIPVVLDAGLQPPPLALPAKEGAGSLPLALGPGPPGDAGPDYRGEGGGGNGGAVGTGVAGVGVDLPGDVAGLVGAGASWHADAGGSGGRSIDQVIGAGSGTEPGAGAGAGAGSGAGGAGGRPGPHSQLLFCGAGRPDAYMCVTWRQLLVLSEGRVADIADDVASPPPLDPVAAPRTAGGGAEADSQAPTASPWRGCAGDTSEGRGSAPAPGLAEDWKASVSWGGSVGGDICNSDGSCAVPMRSGAHPPCFLLDNMLGRLCRWLRCLGVDAELISTDQPRDQMTALVAQATSHGRVLLTRDAKLVSRRDCGAAFLLETADSEAQLRQVARHFGIHVDASRMMSRCPKCNAAAFVTVSKEAVAGEVSERVYEVVDEFFRCGACSKVFWMGPKSYSAMSLVESMLGRARAATGEA